MVISNSFSIALCIFIYLFYTQSWSRKHLRWFTHTHIHTYIYNKIKDYIKNWWERKSIQWKSENRPDDIKIIMPKRAESDMTK